MSYTMQNFCYHPHCPRFEIHTSQDAEGVCIVSIVYYCLGFSFGPTCPGFMHSRGLWVTVVVRRLFGHLCFFCLEL